METGLIIKDSAQDVATTYAQVRSIIANNPNLTILMELDHSANAAKANLELAETRIIMFGNPKLGTPLMQSSPTVAIDLPQKITVYATASGTKMAYNDPMYLKARHNIQAKDDILSKISGALDAITTKAAQ